MAQLLHPYMTSGKTIALTRWTFVSKVMSLLFNMLSRWVIAFLPRSKRLLISWLQSPCAVILEPPKIKSVTISIVSPSICHEMMGLDAMILVFWIKPAFSLSSFTFIKRLFSSSLSAIRMVSSVVAVHGLNCPMVCGIFPSHGSNQCPLLSKGIFLPLDHQGSLLWILRNLHSHVTTTYNQEIFSSLQIVPLFLFVVSSWPSNSWQALIWFLFLSSCLFPDVI